MNALTTIETLTPATVFAPGGVEAIISKLEADVRAIKTDISTDAGRKEIASLAYKVARSKTALDEMGKTLVSDIKAQAAKIDAERRVIKDRLDALKDEIRKPLTDWEDAEKNRVAGHEQALAAMTQPLALAPTANSSELRAFLDEVNKIAQRDWQEFSARATGTADEVRKSLNGYLAAATKREEEAAELARLRAEQAEREKKEREERIAREAAEKAKAEAEAKAKREAEEAARKAAAEQKRIEQEKAEAQARAEKAEADRLAAIAKAERDAKEAAEKAERDRLAAVEAEKRRQEEAARKAAAEAAAREADNKHRAKVNNAAVAALVAGGIAEDIAKSVVTLIAKRQIPAVSISY
jgi:colicin import membrane protein